MVFTILVTVSQTGALAHLVDVMCCVLASIYFIHINVKVVARHYREELYTNILTYPRDHFVGQEALSVELPRSMISVYYMVLSADYPFHNTKCFACRSPGHSIHKSYLWELRPRTIVLAERKKPVFFSYSE